MFSILYSKIDITIGIIVGTDLLVENAVIE